MSTFNSPHVVSLTCLCYYQGTPKDGFMTATGGVVKATLTGDIGRYGEALIEATTLTPAGRTANLVHSTADSISRASTGQSLAERIADAPRRTDEYFSDESVAARVQKRDEMVQTIKDKTTSITNWLHELVQ